MIHRNIKKESFYLPTQIDEFWNALKRRFLLIKYGYTGKGAIEHEKLINSEEYLLSDVELDIIRTSFNQAFLSYKLSEVDLFDVGSGIGLKAKVIIENFSKIIEPKKIRYVACDFSRELLSLAKKNVLNEFPNLPVYCFELDFENQSFLDIIQRIRRRGNVGLFLLLGQTLGNIENPISVLENIRNSMTMGDVFATGVELFKASRVNEIIRYYQNDTMYQTLIYPISIAGFEKGDGIFETSFDVSTNTIEIHYKIIKDVVLHFDQEEIFLPRGDKILAFMSKRFDLDDLNQLFNRAGLLIDKYLFNKTRTYTILLSKLS